MKNKSLALNISYSFYILATYILATPTIAKAHCNPYHPHHCIQAPDSISSQSKKCSSNRLSEKMHKDIIIELKKNYKKSAIDRYLSNHPKGCRAIFRYRQTILNNFKNQR